MKKLTKQEEAQFLLKTGHRVYPRHPCAPIVRESPSCVYCEETVQPDISQLYHPSTGWLCIRCEKTLKENPEMKDQNTDENVKWPLPGAKTFSITEKEEKGHYTPCEFCEGKGKITPTHKNENLSPMDCPKCRGTGRMWVKQERIRRDIRKAYIFGRIEVASYIKEDAMDMIVCVPSLPRQLANSEWNPINWAFMGKQSFRNDYWSVSREDFAQNYFPTLELAEAEIKRRETGENKSEKAEEKDPLPAAAAARPGAATVANVKPGSRNPSRRSPNASPCSIPPPNGENSVFSATTHSAREIVAIAISMTASSTTKSSTAIFAPRENWRAYLGSTMSLRREKSVRNVRVSFHGGTNFTG